MSHAITLIPGDGIGPEVTDAAVRVLDAAGAKVQWDVQKAGMAALEATGDPMPERTLESIRRTRVALKGPLTTPVGGGYRSVNVALRRAFDLYANVRPARTILEDGRYQGVDLVVVRENTEGLYSGVERYKESGGDPQGIAESVMVVSKAGTERILRYAFEYAVSHGRRKVTLVHKANILKYTQGLMLEMGRAMATEYEGRVAFDDVIVDAACMKLVQDPTPWDVIVCENLFGDILSDLVAGLVGGLGLTAGANIGKGAAIFEAVHGSAPDIAGKGLANPSAVLMSAVMMLEHLGEQETSVRVRSALERTLRAGVVRTRDLGGAAGTEEFTDAVIAAL